MRQLPVRDVGLSHLANIDEALVDAVVFVELLAWILLAFSATMLVLAARERWQGLRWRLRG